MPSWFYEIHWTAVVALVAAGISAYAAWNAKKTADRALRLNGELELVKFREKWLQSLREEMVGFLVAAKKYTHYCMVYPGQKSDAEIVISVMKSSDAITLLMNPDDIEYEALTAKLGALMTSVSTFPVEDNDAELKAIISDTEKLKHFFQGVLKREWERLKSDLRNYENAKNN